MKEVNPKINGVFAERFDLAREEAALLDEEQRSGQVDFGSKPLFGVPCTIKEFIKVKGMPHTGGLVSCADNIATEDAEVVQRIRRAGAVVMATSNVPEGGMWMETFNKIRGRTNNPWNLSRTAGGSSGGEAALVSTGASPFGIGSDIAGSIRIPAGFCGTTGHKPSGRRVPNTGHWGGLSPTTNPFLVIGPLTRTVSDARLLLSILEGADGVDTDVLDWPSPALPDLGSVRYALVDSVSGIRSSAGMRAALLRGGKALSNRGASEFSLPKSLLDKAKAVWSNAMSAASRDGKTFEMVLGRGSPISIRKEAIKFMRRKSEFTLPALGAVGFEKIMNRLPDPFLPKGPALSSLQEDLENELGENGVLLVPPYSREAPRHGAPLLTPLHFVFTGVFSVLEFPATQIPCALSGGLPTGIQVVGPRGADSLCLRLGQVLEDSLGGWRRSM